MQLNHGETRWNGETRITSTCLAQQHELQVTHGSYRLCCRCGVFVINATGNEAYTDDAYHNDVADGARIRDLKTADEIRGIFPPDTVTAPFDGYEGYLNLEGGWAFSSQSISILLSKVSKLGGRVLSGKPVVGSIERSGKTIGVQCADGSAYDADLVVIASGSWTPSTFPRLQLYDKCLATG